MRYDDGFVAYLNGTRIASGNSPPASPTADLGRGRAWSPTRPQCSSRTLSSSQHLNLLRTGTNVLAIHALNASAGDADLLMAPVLEATTLGPPAPQYFRHPATPRTANVPAGPSGEVADTEVLRRPRVLRRPDPGRDHHVNARRRDPLHTGRHRPDGDDGPGSTPAQSRSTGR